MTWHVMHGWVGFSEDTSGSGWLLWNGVDEIVLLEQLTPHKGGVQEHFLPGENWSGSMASMTLPQPDPPDEYVALALALTLPGVSPLDISGQSAIRKLAEKRAKSVK